MGLSGNARWRIPLGVQIVPAAALGFFIMFFPESPRTSPTLSHIIGWLFDHGKPERAIKALAKLHAHGNEEDPIVLGQMDEIKETSAHEGRVAAKSWGQLFKNKSTFRRLVLGVTIQAATQVCPLRAGG
jgi:Sugar (and other) transporter